METGQSTVDMALGTEREHTHRQVTLVMSDTHYMHVLNETVQYVDGGSDVGELMNNRTRILTVLILFCKKLLRICHL